MEIVKLIPAESKIEESKAVELLGNLPQIIEERNILESQYSEIIKMNIENPETWKAARECRLLIQKNRTQGINVWHSTNKEVFLRGGQFVDAVKKREISVNERMENALLEIEKYEQILEEKRLSELQNERVKQLLPYLENAAEIQLSGMENDVWEAYFQTKKQSFEDEQKRIEEERKADELRIKKEKLHNDRKEKALPYYQFLTEYDKTINFGDLEESEFISILSRLMLGKKKYDKEQESIRKENERLQKEREDEAKKVEAERKRLEKERKDLIKKNKLNAIQFLFDHGFENTHNGMQLVKFNYFIGALHYSELENEKEFDSFCLDVTNSIKASAAQAEKEEALNKLAEKEEAERKAKEAEKERLQAELKKGDSEKVNDLINDLIELKTKYSFKSEKYNKKYAGVCELIDKVVNYINQ